MNSVPRILVIEDEPHIARLLQFVLSRNGYAVDVAGTGGAGLLSLHLNSPDAVLLDLNLPDMGGAEVFAAIRANSETRNAAVIILSAHTFEYGVDDSLRDGRTICCSKPVAPSRLLECLAELGIHAPALSEAR